MGLVYPVEGSFWPMLAIQLADLGFRARGRGCMFATLAIGRRVAPLSISYRVDRFVPTQSFLALIGLLRRALLAVLACGAVMQASGLFWLFLVYLWLIGPPVGRASSLALGTAGDPSAIFGWVRLCGTAGWMMGGWLVSSVMLVSGTKRSGAVEAVSIATTLSPFVSVYCLTLPRAPRMTVDTRGINVVRNRVVLAWQRDLSVA
jgi:hypothetical protein